MRRTALSAALAVARIGGGVVLLTGTGSAIARPVTRAQTGRLPEFPRARGVIPVLSSQAALAKRAELIHGALATARSAAAGVKSGTAVRNEEALPPCTRANEAERALTTGAVCYRGGPVLRGPTVHVIFWQGPLEGGGGSGTPHVSLFSTKFEEVVEQYLEGLAKESGSSSNVFATDPEYFEETEEKTVPGEYRMSFTPEDEAVDTKHAFPSHSASECADSTAHSEGPCLLDSDIQKEVSEVATEETDWPTESLNDVYLVLTPPGVGGCFDSASHECAFTTYCAYHGDFGGDGMTPGQQTLYADLPYVAGVEGCDSGVHPEEANEGAEAAGADAVIDDLSHELNETITDPIGSQCDEESGLGIVGCEPLSWTDAAGQEIADKCLPPETPEGAIYGNALGTILSGEHGESAAEVAASRYNQVIDGHDYWTQRQWSNEAGGFFERLSGGLESEGACVQRMLGVPVPSVSAGPAAGVPTTFSVAASAAEGNTYWIWNFGDGQQVGSESPTLTHTYALRGTYEVSVTAFDPYGSSRGHTFKLSVGPAPPVPPPSPPTVITTTTTVTASVRTPVVRFSAAQLATKLGLPASGATLAGLGAITFGHGTCPPACEVRGRLTTRVSSVSHHHHKTRTVAIGSVSLSIAPGGTGTIALTLNSAGRSLLRSRHRLSALLSLNVTDEEGGSWQLSRSVTLTASAGKSSRSSSRARR